MAALNDAGFPHWEAVRPPLPALLRHIGQQPVAQRFYLAGGTALALQLGHRVSVDLDFFSERDDVSITTRNEIIVSVRHLQPVTLENADGNLLLEVHGAHVGFFSYGYTLLEPTRIVEGIALASVVDIGLMKLDAIIGRGARKDFYDLYFVARTVPLERLLELGERKYPYARDFEVMAVQSLAFFENADRDVQPELLIPVPWDDVRGFFIDQARALSRRRLTEEQ